MDNLEKLIQKLRKENKKLKREILQEIGLGDLMNSMGGKLMSGLMDKIGDKVNIEDLQAKGVNGIFDLMGSIIGSSDSDFSNEYEKLKSELRSELESNYNDNEKVKESIDNFLKKVYDLMKESMKDYSSVNKIFDNEDKFIEIIKDKCFEEGKSNYYREGLDDFSDLIDLYLSDELNNVDDIINLIELGLEEYFSEI